MKTFIKLSTLAMLILFGTVSFANEKVSELPAKNSAADTDLMYLVDYANPTVPVSKSISFANVKASINLNNQYAVVNIIQNNGGI